MILILTGVSGVGKTTIAEILEKQYNFKRSVSYTTRDPREGETNEIDYNFIAKQTFKEKIEKNEFLEYVQQFDNFYGTAYENLEKAVEKQHNIVMCLTKPGFIAAKKRWPNLVLGVYLAPPKVNILKERIKLRNTSDLDERMQAIYSTANSEKNAYDLIINPDTIENVLNKILLEIKKLKL